MLTGNPPYSADFSVPSIFFCDARWISFVDAKTSGEPWLKALNFCYQQLNQAGNVSQASVDILRQWAKASAIHLDKNGRYAASRLIALTALTDALNACSGFCLLSFLAFIGLYPQQKKQQLCQGMLFIATLGGDALLAASSRYLFLSNATLSQDSCGARWVSTACLQYTLLENNAIACLGKIGLHDLSVDRVERVMPVAVSTNLYLKHCAGV